MNFIEVKKGLLKRMQEDFPKNKYKYYSMAVTENFQRPCFFTQLKPYDMSPANYNSRTIKATFYIDYLQEVADEADALEAIDKIIESFGLGVKIGDRFVDVISTNYDFIGTDRNIPEISIDIEWNVEINHKEDLPMIETAEINKEIMED